MISFDRVADIYDTTRAVPDEALERVADRIVEATRAGPETEFLEPGIGTGRIAIPLVRRGYRYTGVDVSKRMMERLRVKAGDAPNLRLLEGDVTHLPLPDASVDVVVTVHLLHLVKEWQKALEEIARVLRPTGYFVQGQDGGVPGSPSEEIRAQWRRFVTDSGVTLRPPFGTQSRIVGWLTERGYRVAQYYVADWTDQFRPIELIEALHNRTFSQTWDIPEDVLHGVHDKLLPWAKEQYGDLNQPVDSQEEFLVSIGWLD